MKNLIKKLFDRKKEVPDDDELFQLTQIENLKHLRSLVAHHHSQPYVKTVQLIDDCLAEVDKPKISLLVIELNISWLVREIGSMLSSKMLVFSDKETEVWDQLKALSGSRVNIR